jgi:hypothetical protein
MNNTIAFAAATSARETFNNEDPLVKFDTVVGGTRHTLDFAVKLYGRHQDSLDSISERP